jgi:MFS family permease
MASAEITGGTTIAPGRAALPQRSTWGLIQLAIFWIATNFHWTIIPAIILPQQVQAYLYVNHPAGLTGQALQTYIKNAAPGALAFVVGPGLLVALIANPLFGYLSDRTSLRWGRRRPYILIGTLANVGGLAIMALAPNLLVLTAGLMVVQLANNAAAAPFHAFLPDLVPESQRGKASGFMGIGQMVGTIVGAEAAALFFHIDVQALKAGTQSFAAYQQNLLAIYAFIALFITIFAVVTVLVVKEQPPAKRTDMPTASGMRSSSFLGRDLTLTVVGIIVITVATAFIMNLAHVDFVTDQNFANLLVFPALIIGSIGVVRAFDFRPRQYADFAWVLATRAIMMLGIYTVFGFLQLYLQNVTLQHTADPEKGAVAASGNFLAIVIVMAAVSTGFAGMLSDRIGRKRMVYISGAFMALVGLIFTVISVLFPTAGVGVTYICAAIFGLGYGSYVSVDWALVTDVLPSEENFARDMGVWNVALTAPQVIAYIIGALAINTFDRGGTFAVGGQPTFGYTMLFILLVVYATLGTITVRNIKGVKR